MTPTEKALAFLKPQPIRPTLSRYGYGSNFADGSEDDLTITNDGLTLNDAMATAFEKRNEFVKNNTMGFCEAQKR